MRFFYKMQEEAEECQEQEVCKPVTNLVCNTVMKKVIFQLYSMYKCIKTVSIYILPFFVIGRWVAKLVAHLLGSAAL
jgi:hypothetical protein